MKKLNKMLLVHWFYFSHEVIEFDKINFLTGKNASGKSTIIDALQLLLLADTSGSYFNKAANEKGNRTLLGYLRGELGDDGDNGYKYLRNGRFTSYIAAEFLDDVTEQCFTAGCCFDYYSDSDIPHLFFCYDGEMHKTDFIVDGNTMDILSLRKYISPNFSGKRNCLTDSGKQFRDYFYGKLGALPQKFSSILKKAVPFTPISDIQKFITEFVCDDAIKPDVGLMQENINHYKDLEKRTQALGKQIKDLEDICDVHYKYSENVQQELIYNYLIDRSNQEEAKEKLNSLIKELGECKSNLEQANLDIITKKDIRQLSQQKRDELITALNNNDIYKKIETLENTCRLIENNISVAESNFALSQKLVTDTANEWILKYKRFKSNTENVDVNGIEPLIVERIYSFKKIAFNFNETVNMMFLNHESARIVEYGTEFFQKILKQREILNKNAIEISNELQKFNTAAAGQLNQNRTELDKLKKGIFTYPRTVTMLQQAILQELQSEFGFEAHVDIFASLIEIKNERWRNAIEGYLNSQKLYLIVAPEHFAIARDVYDRIKEQQNIHSAGVVNMQEIMKQSICAKENGLAEEIITSNPYAKAYADFLLGNVVKCETATKLTEYSVAITDKCMLYKGYVLRRLNPNLWEKPVIGQLAIKHRIKVLEDEIACISRILDNTAKFMDGISDFCSMKTLSDNDVCTIINNAQETLKIPDLKQQLQAKKDEIARTDKSPIIAMNDEKEDLDKKISELDSQLSTLDKQTGKYGQMIDDYKDDIFHQEKEILSLAEKITKKYEADWAESKGEIKLTMEYGQGKSYSTIIQNFERQLHTTINRKMGNWNNLIQLRTSYINAYKEGFSVNETDNEVYEEKWLELSDIQLPQYQSKIVDAKEKAYEQFQEDFLSKLKANIKNAEWQIDDLNNAIKGGNFSGDRYKFLATAKPETKRFYDMITSNILEGGYNLLSNQFNETYKNEIDELFAIITSNGTNEDYNKQIEMYTDYRTYLNFDLQVIDEEGNIQHLSKTLTKKSGGETQTPFYIAVLASFAQIYRIGREKAPNTIRIIIFDEAFSKMDGDRIRKSIELLRRFDFQVILSAPPDKVADIATFVDRNLCVLRNGSNTAVKVFDPKKLGLELGNQ